MQKKFKQDIVKKVKEEVLQEKRQEALKEKYEIADDVVVVEKSNMIKWTIRTMVAFIRCICAILIFLIADRWLCFTISNHKTHTCHARMAYLTGCGVYDDLRIKEEL